MKIRILSLLIISTFALSANAQFLRGGLNFANVTITNDGDIDYNKMLTSYQLGIIGDFKILPVLYIQPGIVFSGKGSKTESGDPNGPTWYKAATNPKYIEIPVNLVFKTPKGPVKFFAGAGPYIAIGVAGKNKVDGRYLNAAFSSEENIKWSDDDPSTLNYEEGAGYGILKRVDYGLNATAGIEFTKALLSINYGLGMAKLQSGSNNRADDLNKHRVISVTLGIRLD